MLFGAFLFILCSLFITNLDAYCNKDSKNMDLKLKSDLLCDYDTELRPPGGHTPIQLKCFIRNIDHDDDNTITIQSIIRQRWNDSRLEWNPDKYEGIKGIYVQSDYFWMPKLFLNDSHFHSGLGSCHETSCLIKYDGDVICQFPCHQTAHCNSNFTEWPFDSQTCDVVFRTFLTPQEVSFDSEELGGNITADYNKKWKLIKASANMNLTDKTNVKFTFIMQRYAGAIFKHVHIPGYVLITLTLSVLWMKQGSFMRLVVCGLNIFLHFGLMDRVWWQTPSYGFGVPRIMKYMSLMLVSATIVLAESIFLKPLTEPNHPSSQWVKSLTNFLSENAILKHFIIAPFDTVTVENEIIGLPSSQPSENEEEPAEENIRVEEKSNDEWKIFCRFIDRTLFIVLIIGFATYKGY